MAITTDLQTFKINYLTQDQYNNALDNNQISPTELYCVASNVVNIGGWTLDADNLSGHLSLRYDEL